MLVSVVRWQRYGRWALTVGCTVGSLMVLQGCTTTADQHETQVQQAYDGVVPYNEPDTRRRARIRLELASSYFENAQPSVALDEINQSLAADPTYADAFSMRGLIYLSLQEYDTSETAFRRALALSPKDANILHNYGWLQCQQKKYAEADQKFLTALQDPAYRGVVRTLMAQGVCRRAAGQEQQAEESFKKAFELDASNPIVGINLAALLFARGEAERAQFYARRVNNSEFANAESLWLGIRIERSLGQRVAMQQLAEQLRKRFPESEQWLAFEQGAFP